MIERPTIDGLVKYAKKLVDNLKGRQIISAKTTKIYRIEGGTKVLTIPANSINSFAISFLPNSGNPSHAELLLDLDIEYTNVSWGSFDAQITPFQPVDGTDWLVRYHNRSSNAVTKSIGVAVNALENGTIILR